jgi:hypothetical protein
MVATIVDNPVSVAVGMPDHPLPSERARELVRGAFDPYVHVAPDFAPRRITDLELARRCLELGLAGFGLMSHYTATHERAAVVNAAVGAEVAVGSIVLNHAVGGLNATAVEVAARQGVRFVWLPTVSSAGEFAKAERADPDGNVPVWVRFELELRAAGAPPRAVAVLDAQGAPLPALLEVLTVVARHGLVLNTGHLSRDETFAVVDAGVAAGVETIVVTNPEFPTHTLAPADQEALAARGALLQRALTTPYTGKCTWDAIFDATRAVGAEHTAWGSDLGQVFNPPVEDGLAIMADRHLEAGFSDEEVRVMAVDNTRRLAGLDARA